MHEKVYKLSGREYLRSTSIHSVINLAKLFDLFLFDHLVPFFLPESIEYFRETVKKALH